MKTNFLLHCSVLTAILEMKRDCARVPIQDFADISSNLLASLNFCKVA